VNVDTSYLVYRLTVASPSLRAIKLPQKGRGYVTWPVLNLGGPINISEWLKLELSNFVQRETIAYQVLPKGWQITPKKNMVFLTWPIFVCTTVDFEKILHGIPLTVINNVVDDGLLLIAPTVLEATLRPRSKLHRFYLSLYLLPSWLCNI